MPPDSLPLVVFMHIEVQHTHWLYFLVCPCFNPDKQFFATCLDAAKDGQPGMHQGFFLNMKQLGQAVTDTYTRMGIATMTPARCLGGCQIQVVTGCLQSEHISDACR